MPKDSRDFLNDPKFNVEGLDDIKQSVDNFFLQHKEAVVKPEATEMPKKKRATKPKVAVKLPEPEKQSLEDVAEAVGLTLDEIDEIRESFYNFQDSIGHLAIYPYIYADIEKFVESCLEMQDMIEDNIDVAKLSKNGLKDYEEMQKVRARILSTIFNHYKKDK